MDTAIQIVAHSSLPGFLRRWLGAWMLATAPSAILLGLFYVLVERYRARPVIAVAFIGLLSLPALGGLLQGIAMRGFLRRSTLWGTLTGGGIVFAAAGVTVALFNLDSVWLPVEFRLAALVAEVLGLVSPPVVFVGTILISILFGSILGAVQAIALAPRWLSALAWVAASIVASVLMGLWIYAWIAIEPVKDLFVRSAELVPLAGQWRYLPVGVAWAEIGALCFALPTGLFMQRLVRRHQRGDDEALLRRFE